MDENSQPYRRWRRWVAMLLSKFGYNVASLATRFQTSEAVSDGTKNPGRDLWRLRARAIRLIGLPSELAGDADGVVEQLGAPPASEIGSLLAEYSGHPVVSTYAPEVHAQSRAQAAKVRGEGLVPGIVVETMIGAYSFVLASMGAPQVVLMFFDP